MQNLAEKEFGPIVLRVVEKLIRRVGFDDLAVVHEQDGVPRVEQERSRSLERWKRSTLRAEGRA